MSLNGSDIYLKFGVPQRALIAEQIKLTFYWSLMPILILYLNLQCLLSNDKQWYQRDKYKRSNAVQCIFVIAALISKRSGFCFTWLTVFRNLLLGQFSPNSHRFDINL